MKKNFNIIKSSGMNAQLAGIIFCLTTFFSNFAYSSGQNFSIQIRNQPDGCRIGQPRCQDRLSNIEKLFKDLLWSIPPGYRLDISLASKYVEGSGIADSFTGNSFTISQGGLKLIEVTIDGNPGYFDLNHAAMNQKNDAVICVVAPGFKTLCNADNSEDEREFSRSINFCQGSGETDMCVLHGYDIMRRILSSFIYDLNNESEYSFENSLKFFDLQKKSQLLEKSYIELGTNNISLPSLFDVSTRNVYRIVEEIKAEHGLLSTLSTAPRDSVALVVAALEKYKRSLDTFYFMRLAPEINGADKPAFLTGPINDGDPSPTTPQWPYTGIPQHYITLDPIGGNWVLLTNFKVKDESKKLEVLFLRMLNNLASEATLKNY